MGKIDDWVRAALRKCGRSHKKRHSVNRERSHEARMKAHALEVQREQTVQSARKYKNRVRSFWLGEAEHPGEFRP